ncbi:hypothetical protein RZ517_05835 [Roseovarius sp. S88]|uniref:Uncharacterized protein n=1 Tax=Roseovarius phycicola TaxID=3080976 RepID=A0ABZ2HHZ5_9RHOB
MLFVAIFVGSIALNLAFVVGGALFSVASSAFHSATGMRTVAMQHADEVADLSGELAQERAAKRQLRGELSEVTADLASERTVTRRLRSEVGDVIPDRVVYRGRKVAVQEAVETTSNRISKRAVKTSSREIGAMAGEALPYVGIAVVVGATALELKDLCDTLKDMSELRRALDPGSAPSEDEQTVCATRVPTAEEVWETVKASPGNAWQSAKAAVPTLEEIKSYELPDVDWEEYWDTSADWFASTADGAKSGVSRFWEKSLEGAGDLIDDTRKYLQPDEQQAQ